MKFSIILATYNRKDDLIALLKSLADQDYDPNNVEVVIVDDGSADGTAEAVSGFRKSAPYRITYQFQQNSGPGAARTRGMELATGNMFLFIDTDCTVPPGYLAGIADEHDKSPFDAFGGPDTANIHFSAWDKAVSFTLTSFLTTGGLRGSTGKKLARYYPRSFNMGLKRRVFEKIGGFGSIFQYGEDIEYSHRILKSGATVRFLPGAVVYHKRRSSPAAFARQVYRMGRARIQLWRIDRSLLEPLHTLPLVATLTGIIWLIMAVIFGGVAALSFVILIVLGSLVIGITGAVQIRSLTALPLIPAAFLIQTVAYGTGMLIEWVTGKK
ncbi:MAG: glycosyltransferase [Cyclonatronaceae bacterium]